MVDIDHPMLIDIVVVNRLDCQHIILTLITDNLLSIIIIIEWNRYKDV